MDTPALAPIAAARPPVLFLCLLPLYPALSLAGALTHWQGFSVAAVGLLLALLLWPALRRGRPLSWLLWVVLMGGMVWLSLRGLAALALETVPVWVSGVLAWLFGRTLRDGRQPLIARIIEAV